MCIIGLLLIAEPITTDEAIFRGDLAGWIFKLSSDWLVSKDIFRFLLADIEAILVEHDDGLFFGTAEGEVFDLRDLICDLAGGTCERRNVDGFKPMD